MKNTKTKKSEQQEKLERSERFYNWLVKTKNVYLHDNEQVTKSFELITV